MNRWYSGMTILINFLTSMISMMQKRHGVSKDLETIKSNLKINYNKTEPLNMEVESAYTVFELLQ